MIYILNLRIAIIIMSLLELQYTELIDAEEQREIK